MNLRVFFLDNKKEHEGVKVRTEPSSVGKNLMFQKSCDDCSHFITLTPEGSVVAGVLTKALTLASCEKDLVDDLCFCPACTPQVSWYCLSTAQRLLVEALGATGNARHDFIRFITCLWKNLLADLPSLLWNNAHL